MAKAHRITEKLPSQPLQTYSIVVDDGCGISETYKVKMTFPEVSQAIHSACWEFAYMEITPKKNRSQVSVNYRLFAGHYMDSANSLRHMAKTLTGQCPDEWLEVLCLAASEFERDKAFQLCSGSILVKFSQKWIEEYGE